MKKLSLLVLFFVVSTSLAQTEKIILENPKYMYMHRDTDDDGVFDYSEETELLPDTKVKIVRKGDTFIVSGFNGIEDKVYQIIPSTYKKAKNIFYVYDKMLKIYLFVHIENKDNFSVYSESLKICINYTKDFN